MGSGREWWRYRELRRKVMLGQESPSYGREKAGQQGARLVMLPVLSIEILLVNGLKSAHDVDALRSRWWQ